LELKFKPSQTDDFIFFLWWAWDLNLELLTCRGSTHQAICRGLTEHVNRSVAVPPHYPGTIVATAGNGREREGVSSSVRKAEETSG
jgi:hypothetical protein